jgi:glutamine synthetase adenylyltransferase
MGELPRLQAFAEDLVVFRQLTTPEERAEFAALMKRAYAQRISASAFVQRSPERRVSTRIRRLCETVLARATSTAIDDTRANHGRASADRTDFTPQPEP